MTSFFYVVSYCHLSATLQTMSFIVETYKTIELGFEFVSYFLGFYLTSLVIYFVISVSYLRSTGMQTGLTAV